MKVYLWSSLTIAFWEQVLDKGGMPSRLVSYAKERDIKTTLSKAREKHASAVKLEWNGVSK